jgi:hypothetical protein
MEAITFVTPDIPHFRQNAARCSAIDNQKVSKNMSKKVRTKKPKDKQSTK